VKWPESIVITEVGPRDGLQNEARPIPVEGKVALIERLAQTGLRRIEAVSFVHPRAVPQMANAEEVMASLRRYPGVAYIGLVPNLKGAQRAVAAGVDELATVVSASQSHNRANLNATIEETMTQIAQIAALAKDAGLPWAGYISTAFGCPYEGKVDADVVISLGQALHRLGAYAVSLGDTIGVANPRQVYELVSRFLKEVPGVELRLHFHDTRGVALANVVAAMQAGATQFDGSVGGLGGCPYAPGASGNVATEDLVAMAEAMGIRTGVDLHALVEVSWFAEELVGRPLDGKVRRALRRPP
jgi:hydroxymethylglutaryl-CoA lyase